MTTHENSSFNIHFSNLNDPRASAASLLLAYWTISIQSTAEMQIVSSETSLSFLFSCDFETLKFQIHFAFLKTY